MEQLELAAHAQEFDKQIQLHQLTRNGSPLKELTQTSATKEKSEPEVHAGRAPDPVPAASICCNLEEEHVVKDRGWAAWTFLLASAATEFMVWGASYGYGSFQDYHQHNPDSPFHDSSITALSAIGTLLLGGQHFIPLITVGLYTIFPSLVKRFSLACVVGSALCLLIASFSNSVALLIVFQGLLLGVFGGNLFTATILWLPNWWDTRRGFATACIFGGSALGGVAWPIIFTQLLERVGFRWTLRCWALIQFVVSGAAIVALRPGRRLESASRPIRWRGIVPGFPRSLLSTLTLLNAVVLTAQTTAWYSISLNISNYATSMGLSSSTSTGILSAHNASAALTYPILALLIDRFSYPLIMATSAFLCATFTFLVFGFAGSSFTKIMLYVVFFGISGGGFSSFLTPVSRDIPDRSHSHEFSLRFLYLVFVRGVAAMLGPLIAVQFYPDKLGGPSAYGSFGFTGFIVFIGGAFVVCFIGCIAVFIYKRWTQSRSACTPVH